MDIIIKAQMNKKKNQAIIHNSSYVSDADSEDSIAKLKLCKGHKAPQNGKSALTGKIRGLVHKNKCFDIFQKTKVG